MDGIVRNSGNGFRVRVYNLNLDYKIKQVRKYKTSNRHVHKYHVTGHRGTIVINRLQDQYSVTYISRHKGVLYFPHDYDEINMVCEAATMMLKRPVVPHTEDEPKLF